MEPSKLRPLVEHVTLLPDPRVDRPTRPLLLDMVVIAGCAVIGGADTWVDIEEYGHAKYEWLKRWLPLSHGIPSHDTFARLFARLAPEALRTCVLAWLTEVRERIVGPRASQVVAIEGKAARQSFDRALDRGPLHMGRAWATAARVVLGQVAVEQKRHESTAIPT